MDDHKTFSPPRHLTGRDSPVRRGQAQGSCTLPGGPDQGSCPGELSGQRDPACLPAASSSGTKEGKDTLVQVKTQKLDTRQGRRQQ